MNWTCLNVNISDLGEKGRLRLENLKIPIDGPSLRDSKDIRPNCDLEPWVIPRCIPVFIFPICYCTAFTIKTKSTVLAAEILIFDYVWDPSDLCSASATPDRVFKARHRYLH
jgi:hypothetical protein